MKIGVIGAAGRMGRMIMQAIIDEDGAAAIAGAVDHGDCPDMDRDIGRLTGMEDTGIRVTADAAALFRDADAVIEFSTPRAVASHAALAAQYNTVWVIGTTGLEAEDEALLQKTGQKTPVVYAPNMSLGVNLLLGLVQQVAAALPDDFDIEIVEMHHRFKADAPSGTALGLGRAAASGRGVDLDSVADKVRDGVTGPRKRGDIGFATLRGGDVVGEHTVVFAGMGERIELTHKATDRAIFARGAVAAAKWAADQDNGLYGMSDVLGLT